MMGRTNALVKTHSEIRKLEIIKAMMLFFFVSIIDRGRSILWYWFNWQEPEAGVGGFG